MAKAVTPDGRDHGRRARTSKLSRERILRSALELVDAEGGSALTMRRLAARLNVEAMSLYHHVRNREDVLDGIADQLVSEIPATAAGDWETAVREFATGIRQVALAHPRSFELVGMRPLATPTAQQAVGTLLSHLRDAGFSPEECVTIYRLAAALARGFTLAEISRLTFSGAADGRDLTVPEELADFEPSLAGNQDDVFATSLDLIVAGIASRVREPRPRRARGA